MFSFLSEIRYAGRDLLARPAWSMLVIAVLAAGLGTVLYVFALVNSLVLRPPPFLQPEQLYIGGVSYEGDDDLESVPQRDADDLTARLQGSAEVAMWSDGTINIVDGERADRHDGSFVSPNLFAVLGIQPLLGAGFSAADTAPNAPVRIAIGYQLWQSQYRGDQNVIGRSVRINGEAAMIVAVMPENFSFPQRSTIWMAARRSATPIRSDDRAMQLVLRIADPAALPKIEATQAAWHAQAKTEDPAAFRTTHPALLPIQNFFIDAATRAMLGVMLLATLLVLLVACGNAANLMLARQLGRQQEFAVRVALGASKARITSGILAHSLMLSLGAAALALLGAQLALQWTMQAFIAAGDGGPPLWMRFDLDTRMVVATVIAAIITALLSGLLPALQLARNVNVTLREGGRGMAGGGFARLGGILVMIEIALSAALLIGALAMVQTVRALNQFDLGVRTDGILTARIGLFDAQYPDAAARLRLFERLTERLRAEPEVIDATVATALPGFMGPNISMLPDRSAITDEPHNVAYSTIDAHFAGTYRTQLLAGRWLDARDRADGDPVAMVDRRFADTFGVNGEVLGMRFRLSPTDPLSRVVTVVGVTENLQLEDADDDAEPTLLVPQAQDTPAFVTVAVYLRGAPGAFKPKLAALMREIDADTPLYWVRTYDEVRSAANFGQNLLAQIYGVFGLVALLLAAGGLYGVVGFTVLQRTREIGVRRALGASPRNVLGAILRRSGWQTGIGLSVGLALGVPFALALSSTMQDDMTLDPLIWILVALLLGGVAALASLLPARRALRVDPIVALRHD